MGERLSNTNLSRIAVVGTSGCGKSTIARHLSQRLGVSHIELDALYWGPNWIPIPADQFKEKVSAATAQPRWICDGNYSPVRDLVCSRATTVVWLNYSLSVVFGRTLRRTLHRWWSRERLFAGNRESLRMSFLSRESILLWVLQTHGERRREYRRLFAAAQFAHLERIEFEHPSQAQQWLTTV
jgi:adenylate kinase family enzyme